MKLLVFGSTGGTGKQIIRQALDNGHQVTAFARNPSRLAIQHPRLRICQGDVMNSGEVEQAIAGQDAVLVSLGTPPSKTARLRSEGTKNVVRAMQKTGVNRLVCQTSLGYGDSRDVLANTPFVFRKVIVPFLLKKTFEDHALQEAVVKETSLDWVIVRPGGMTDGKHTGRYQAGFAATEKKIRVKISRADVADFMLRQVSDNRYLRQTPGISY